MEEKDKKSFLLLMAMLCEAYKEEMTTERGKIYFEFLRKYSLFQVKRSIEHIIKKNIFFPKIADIISLIDPDDGYQLMEGEKTKELRLKQENKETSEYINRILEIMSKNKGHKQLT